MWSCNIEIHGGFACFWFLKFVGARHLAEHRLLWPQENGNYAFWFRSAEGRMFGAPSASSARFFFESVHRRLEVVFGVSKVKLLNNQQGSYCKKTWNPVAAAVSSCLSMRIIFVTCKAHGKVPAGPPRQVSVRGLTMRFCKVDGRIFMKHVLKDHFFWSNMFPLRFKVQISNEANQTRFLKRSHLGFHFWKNSTYTT